MYFLKISLLAKTIGSAFLPGVWALLKARSGLILRVDGGEENKLSAPEHNSCDNVRRLSDNECVK